MEEGTFTLTADDVVAANRLHWKQAFGWRGVLIPLVLIIVGCCVWLRINYGWIPLLAYPLVAASLTAIVALFELAIWLVTATIARHSWRQSKKMWIEQKVRCSPEEIEFHSERGHARFRWSDFYRWAADKKNLLLYQTARSFIIVPLRNFPPDARETIANMIRAAGLKER